jgi:hypothetical protein
MWVRVDDLHPNQRISITLYPLCRVTFGVNFRFSVAFEAWGEGKLMVRP